MKRALVINTTRMGDLIQSTPLMQGLQASGYEVSLLYSEGFHEIAPMLAGVDHLIPFSLAEIVNPLVVQGANYFDAYKALSASLGRLRRENFDLVINATHSAYSAMMTTIISGARTTGLTCDQHGKLTNTNDWARYYLTSQACRETNRFNLVDIHRMMSGNAGAFPVKLNVPNKANIVADQILAGYVEKDSILIGIVPGASTQEKTYPVEAVAQAVDSLGSSVPVKTVILGAKSESALGGTLERLLPGSLNLCGKTDIATLAALISRCRLILSNDTGPMHIAAAVGTTVIDISLGSALASETAPYGAGHYVIESKIGCHPCLPRLHCTHFTCGRSIPPEAIAKVAGAVIVGKPVVIDGDGCFDSVKLFRTEFDREGFLKLVSLTEAKEDRNAMLYRSMQQVWKEILDVELQEEQENSDYYPSFDFTDVIDTFTKVVEIARIGRDSSAVMVNLAGESTQVETLKQLAGALQEIDRSLARIAYAFPYTMPFLTQFTSMKGSLVSATLADHASMTSGLFQNLENWSTALIARLEKNSAVFNRRIDAA